MASYDWYAFRERRWPDRFPDENWVRGAALWRDRVSQASAESITVLIAELAELRRDTAWGVPPRQCPRVFISHRHDDRDDALAMAKLVRHEGFQFWLDILDPTLQMLTSPPPGVPAPLLIAAVIEMALLNCTHVVAIMTLQTHGGMWVPYEYGRVKEPAVSSPAAAAWLHPSFAKAIAAGTLTLPEYMLLGEQLPSAAKVRGWLQRERNGWQKRFGACLNGPNGATDAVPEGAGDLPEPTSLR